MVPIRFISEKLGAKVDWEDKKIFFKDGLIIISNDEKLIDENLDNTSIDGLIKLLTDVSDH